MMLNKLKKLGADLGAAISSLFKSGRKGTYLRDGLADSSATAGTSARDLERPSDAFAVKRKLGPSWFTRRLNTRTRRARLIALTSEERAIAREQGWLL